MAWETLFIYYMLTLSTVRIFLFLKETIRVRRNIDVILTIYCSFSDIYERKRECAPTVKSYILQATWRSIPPLPPPHPRAISVIVLLRPGCVISWPNSVLMFRFPELPVQNVSLIRVDIPMSTWLRSWAENSCQSDKPHENSVTLGFVLHYVGS